MSEPGTLPEAATAKRPRARSDDAFPSLALMAALGGLLSVAAIVLGYRVFSIEATRREVNDSLRLIAKSPSLLQEAQEHREQRDAAIRERKAEQDALSRLLEEKDQLIAATNESRGKASIAASDLKALEQRLGDTKSELKKTESQRAEAVGARDSAKQEADRHEQTRDTLLQQVADLEKAVIQRRKDTAELDGQLDGLRKAKGQAEATLADIKQGRADFVTVLEAIRTDAAKVATSTTELDRDRQQFVTTASSVTQQLDGVLKKLDPLTTEATDLLKQLSTASNTLAGASVRGLPEAASGIGRVGDDIAAVADDLRHDQARLRAQLDDLTAALASAKQRVSDTAAPAQGHAVGQADENLAAPALPPTALPAATLQQPASTPGTASTSDRESSTPSAVP